MDLESARSALAPLKEDEETEDALDEEVEVPEELTLADVVDAEVAEAELLLYSMIRVLLASVGSFSADLEHEPAA